MKTKNLQIILLLVVFTFFNCSNNDDPIEQDQLPPISQTGANTFGAVVNGKVFITKDKTDYTPPGVGTPKGLSILGNNRTFVIQATNYEDTYIYIYIPKDFPDERTYNFQNSTGVEYSLSEPNFPHIYATVNGTKYLSFLDSGFINFTKIDINDGIFSGIFEVKLKNKNNQNDIIEITDGRFDL